MVVSTPHAAANIGRTSSTMLWAKPGIGFLKLNVDGVYNANSLMGGVGAVIRDSDGNFVAGLAMAFDHVSSPLFAKALAVREGLALVSSRGFQNVLVESDSLQITQALGASSMDLSPVGIIVEDSKAFASEIT